LLFIVALPVVVTEQGQNVSGEGLAWSRRIGYPFGGRHPYQ
jgi:hypothetical protein